MTIKELERQIRDLKKELNYIDFMSNKLLNIIHELEENIMDLEEIKMNEVNHVLPR